MNTTILVAIITGLCTAVPCVISTFVTNNTREALQSERLNNMLIKIDELSKKVDNLSDFDKRLAIIEHDIEILKGAQSHE